MANAMQSMTRSVAPFSGCNASLRPQAAVVRSRRTVCQPQNAIKEIFMPALSSTMTEGKIVSWLKSPGDKIRKGESVVVVESDKADMDVESFSEGFLGGIVIEEGGMASVGEPIAYVAETEAELEEAKAKAAGGASSNGAAAPPAPVEAAAPVQAAAAVAAPAAPAAVAAPPPPPPPPPPPAAPVGRTDGRIIATPYAKKLAKDFKIELASISGTGPAGRITAADVEAAKGGRTLTAAAPVATASAPAAAAAVAAAPAAAPQAPVPEFRVSYTVTTTALDALYAKLKPKGVTMTALLAKAAGVALVSHPLLYAACTADGSGITYSENINVALAVSMPDGGLITPVLKNADQTDIFQLSRQWADLVKRARSKALSPDEYNSGTFTISNLGMFGAHSFDAILPPGSAAILAVAASKPTVTADANGRIGVEKQMVLNLTCDHRVVYGADAAEFMLTLKKVIESPDQLIF